jgi:hypothetical protein
MDIMDINVALFVAHSHRLHSMGNCGAGDQSFMHNTHACREMHNAGA